MAQKLPNLAKCINLQIQEAEETPNRINPKKSMPRSMVCVCLKLDPGN